jgi:hypothetical protein
VVSGLPLKETWVTKGKISIYIVKVNLSKVVGFKGTRCGYWSAIRGGGNHEISMLWLFNVCVIQLCSSAIPDEYFPPYFIFKKLNKDLPNPSMA